MNPRVFSVLILKVIVSSEKDVLTKIGFRLSPKACTLPVDAMKLPDLLLADVGMSMCSKKLSSNQSSPMTPASENVFFVSINVPFYI